MDDHVVDRVQGRAGPRARALIACTSTKNLVHDPVQEVIKCRSFTTP